MGFAEFCSLNGVLFAWFAFLRNPLTFLSPNDISHIIKIKVPITIGIKPSQQWGINKWASHAPATSEGVTERKRIVEPQP